MIFLAINPKNNVTKTRVENFLSISNLCNRLLERLDYHVESFMH